MFEKEAEEILNKHCNCEFIFECIDGTRIRCSDFEDKKKLLLEGIEFGYNKANEWHYIKDGDLPNDQRIVEVFTKDKDTFIAYIDNEGEEWYVGQYFRKILSMDYVIAWRDFVYPEEVD